MHRFFLTPADIVSEELLLVRSSELVHQWTKVLRFEIGEHIKVFDGSGFEWEVEIAEMKSKEIFAKVVGKSRPETEFPVKVFLAQSFLKNVDRFELVLQKGTELGFSGFIPLITDRTERKFLQKGERFQRIITEAAEQSGRVAVPEFLEPMSFSDVLKKYPFVILPHPAGEISFAMFRKSLPKIPQEMVFCVGPEGGFSDREILLAQESGVHIVSLGCRILRSETVSMVLGAALNEWIGQL